MIRIKHTRGRIYDLRVSDVGIKEIGAFNACAGMKRKLSVIAMFVFMSWSQSGIVYKNNFLFRLPIPDYHLKKERSDDFRLWKGKRPDARYPNTPMLLVK